MADLGTLSNFRFRSLVSGCDVISGVATLLHSRIPILAILNDLVCIELSSEAAPNLGVLMAVETQDREIAGIVIRGVLVDMVYLSRLSALPADATHPICSKQEQRSGLTRNGYARFGHLREDTLVRRSSTAQRKPHIRGVHLGRGAVCP